MLLSPCTCFIIPSSVLKKYSRDDSLDDDTRKALQDSYLETERLRTLREAYRQFSLREPLWDNTELAAPVPA